jgi:hypothetical protein
MPDAERAARPASVEDLKGLLPYLVTIDFDGVPVRTLSVEGLLKTKQSSRDKDKLDRLILEKALDELKKG